MISAPSNPATGDSKDSSVDLDAAEELASRSLLLGILHRAAGEYEPSRSFLEHAMTFQSEISTSWVIPTAMFELATLDLVEVERVTSKAEASDIDSKDQWKKALDGATSKLDKISTLAANTTLSTRIESRVQMLRDEVGYKRGHLGL